MNKEFKKYIPTEDGKKGLDAIPKLFDKLLNDLELMLPDSREFSIVKTKLEEACFYANKCCAMTYCEPEDLSVIMIEL